VKALVTGGGGFLGQAIVRQLVARGDAVTVLSRGAYPELAPLGVMLRRGSVTSMPDVTDAARGCDVVFHVAAKAGIWGMRDDYEASNVTGTANVLAACRALGIHRLVHTSSPSVVFGSAPLEGVDESVPYATHFLADYPRTKAAAERLVLAANDASLATVALRPHLIWGPGDVHLVPRIVARAKAGKLRLVGDGRNVVDSVYVHNAAAAHLLAADRCVPGSAVAGKVYFISNGEPLPIGELIGKILAAAGLPPLTRRIPVAVATAAGALLEGITPRAAKEPLMTRFLAAQLSTAHWFDISAARRDLAYEPAITIDEGMKRLADWLRTIS